MPHIVLMNILSISRKYICEWRMATYRSDEHPFLQLLRNILICEWKVATLPSNELSFLQFLRFIYNI